MTAVVPGTRRQRRRGHDPGRPAPVQQQRPAGEQPRPDDRRHPRGVHPGLAEGRRRRAGQAGRRPPGPVRDRGPASERRARGHHAVPRDRRARRVDAVGRSADPGRPGGRLVHARAVRGWHGPGRGRLAGGGHRRAAPPGLGSRGSRARAGLDERRDRGRDRRRRQDRVPGDRDGDPGPPARCRRARADRPRPPDRAGEGGPAAVRRRRHRPLAELGDVRAVARAAGHPDRRPAGREAASPGASPAPSDAPRRRARWRFPRARRRARSVGGPGGEPVPSAG